MNQTRKSPKLCIDAGIAHIRLRYYDAADKIRTDLLISSNNNLSEAFAKHDILDLSRGASVYITGKLAEVVHNVLGKGDIILPAAALWASAEQLAHDLPLETQDALAVIDLSASGYLLIGVKSDGSLKDDTLILNPRCGAGSGVNMDRILQKLALERKNVDAILEEYLGNAGAANRANVNVRADRCGVFSSSATISDKNQGIPISFALAVTLKSEVLKTCKKLPTGFKTVWLTGRVFAWQYARDCAEDYLRSIGVEKIEFDADNILPIAGLKYLAEKIGEGNFSQPEKRLNKKEKIIEYPSFVKLKEKFESENLYLRLSGESAKPVVPQELQTIPVIMALDVGSTMAKLVIADAHTQENLFIDSYSNSGDTIETIKTIFRDLQSHGIQQLTIQAVGITGSARYQVQQALAQIFPQIADRVSVLVENYAHARGSIEHARQHIERLRKAGITELNEDFCILVDIGGEDTKISTIALKKGELFDNAMNVKCSAGTGSLVDTLTALLGLKDISEACRLAYEASKGYTINATCAVFLMENARKLQAEGYPKDEILASANWAIVENMARSLWHQVELPKNTVTLLHGQTMLSEPLPLAVTNRLQDFTNAPTYCLVPPHPGHRACLGLIKTFAAQTINTTTTIRLQEFIERIFQKKIIQCRGTACGDPLARCNRTHLSSQGYDNNKFSLTLGGCTAINELLARTNKQSKPVNDSYQAIWKFIDSHHPRSEEPHRLIIPRSFAVSEWAFFLAKIFEQLGIPVHVDNVQEKDIIEAQPNFHIDTCAPHIGAVGQFQRLAGQPHGIILAPQIEFLPIKGNSLGRTCTINQGGIATAANLATIDHPEARFHLFRLNLKSLDAANISHQLFSRLQALFKFYDLDPSEKKLHESIRYALESHMKLKRNAAALAADFAEKALHEGRQIALVIGREYILNPGIYDSHVGRLLRDKGMVALPSYVFDIELDPRFDHIYWRNPHIIATLTAAAVKRKLHEQPLHPRLKEVFKKIETGSDRLLPMVQVSTFLCGPDSVTTPLVSEMTKKRPFLFIQSDAVIKELAHLENRMNTYVKQLNDGLHQKLLGNNAEDFEIKILENFINTEKLDPATDVIYFPTLSDNRILTSVVRSAGLVCIDIYKDGEYDLPAIIKEGRKFAGDAVCAPLAAVYGDILRSVEDFKRRKAKNDPLVQGKKRILIFNNKGSGPCRQGQYVEVHKLFASQRFKEKNAGSNKAEDRGEEALLKYMVAHENKGYNFGLEEWALIQGMQGVILQGVLHQLLIDGGANCRDYEEYQRFLAEFTALKNKLYHIQEHKLKPSERAKKLAAKFAAIPIIGIVVKYFAYRLSDRKLHKALNRFAAKWIHEPRREENDERIKIYVEGEVYMRVAQLEEIFNVLLSSLGFQKFRLGHSPVWCYLDYMLAGMMMQTREAIAEARCKIKQNQNKTLDKTLKKDLFQKIKHQLAIKTTHHLFRHLVAAPLYRAAKVAMPVSMPNILEIAKEVIPTGRPEGELSPYVGEVLLKLRKGYDLIFNVAPEGCMVSSMGEVLTPKIIKTAQGNGGKIQHLFSQQGDVDEEMIALALLTATGPEKFYRKHSLN